MRQMLKWDADVWSYTTLLEPPSRRALGPAQLKFMDGLLQDQERSRSFWMSMRSYRMWFGESIDNAIAHHNWAVMRGGDCRPRCPLPTDMVVVFQHCPCYCSWRVVTMTPAEVKSGHNEYIAREAAKKLKDRGFVELSYSQDGLLQPNVPNQDFIRKIELGCAPAFLDTPWVNSYIENYEKVLSLHDATRFGGLIRGEGLVTSYDPKLRKFTVQRVAADEEDKFARGIRDERTITWDPSLNGRKFVALDKSGHFLTFSTASQYHTFAAARWITSVSTPPPPEGELFVGSFYGGRVFRGADEVGIVGATGYHWKGPVLDAECLYGRRHDVPHERCTCGIYVLTDAMKLYDETRVHSPNTALALVRAYGKLAVGTRGYRAQRVEVLLFVLGTNVSTSMVDVFMKFDVPVLEVEEAFELEKAGINPLEYLERR